MTDELKTIKFQLMLSESEAEAFDDWGFKNRIRTRAEAMRRLCQMGLALDDQLTPLTNSINKATKAFGDLANQTLEVVNATPERRDAAILELASVQMEATIATASLKYTIRELTGKGYAFKAGTSFEETLEEATEVEQLFQEFFEKIGQVQGRLEKRRRPKSGEASNENKDFD